MQDSTLDVHVQSSRARRTARGALLYELSYLLDYDYGRKRVLNGVCIDDATLYIFSLQHKVPDGEALPPVAAAADALLAAFEPGV